jgi:hypothetical protein
MMTSRIAIALATASFGVAGAVLPHAAFAQTAADLVELVARRVE